MPISAAEAHPANPTRAVSRTYRAVLAAKVADFSVLSRAQSPSAACV